MSEKSIDDGTMIENLREEIDIQREEIEELRLRAVAAEESMERAIERCKKAQEEPNLLRERLREQEKRTTEVSREMMFEVTSSPRLIFINDSSELEFRDCDGGYYGHARMMRCIVYKRDGSYLGRIACAPVTEKWHEVNYVFDSMVRVVFSGDSFDRIRREGESIKNELMKKNQKEA